MKKCHQVLTKLEEASHHKKIELMKTMTKEELRAMVVKLKKDNAFFASVCLKHKHPYIPSHHAEAFAIFDDLSIKNVRQVWFRGGGKTTVKRAVIIKRACFGLKRFILNISETNTQALADIDDIKKELESNEILRFLFGDLKGKGPWGVKHLNLSNGVNIKPLGTRDAARGINYDGSRPDDIWLDDFESEKNSDTPEKREAILNWYTYVLLPAVNIENYSINFLGTIVNKDSMLSKQDPCAIDDKGNLTPDAQRSIFRREVKGVSTQFAISRYKYDGTNSDIEPTWPERFSISIIREFFEQYSNSGQLGAFYQEFYNIPATLSNPVINTSMIKEVDAVFKTIGKITYLEYPDKKKVPCRIYIGVDPAVKAGTGNDDFVVFALGLLPNKTYVIIDILAEHVKIEDQAKVVYNQAVLYQAYSVTIECIQYQLSLYEQVKKIQRDCRKSFILTPIDRKMSKGKSYSEIEGLVPTVNAGLVSYVKGCRNINKLIIQANAFSAGSKREHDDTLDGFYLALLNNYFPPMANIDDLIKKLSEQKKDKRVRSFMAL